MPSSPSEDDFVCHYLIAISVMLCWIACFPWHESHQWNDRKVAQGDGRLSSPARLALVFLCYHHLRAWHWYLCSDGID